MAQNLPTYDDSGVRRVLAVVAHPDDMEYGGAAAVAQWTSRGVDVAYVLASSGEAGIATMPPDEAGPVREQEQREACARVGVDDVRFLGFPDGTIEYGLALRRALAAEIRRFRPDTLVTGAFRESWPGGLLNQADHIAVGRALVDAARDAGNRWVYPDLLEQGLEPWNGAAVILAMGSPVPTAVLDVSEGFEAGVSSLEAHGEYLRALGEDMPPPHELLDGMLGESGRQAGVRHAIPLETLLLQLY